MRILQIFNNYVEKGGEEVIVARLGEGLGEGVEVETLYLTEDQVESHELLKLMGLFFRMFRNRKSLDLVTGRIEEFKPDVAVLHNFMPLGSLALLGNLKKLGLPVVYYVHNYRPYSVNGYLWGKGRVMDDGIRKNFIPEILSAAWQGSRIKTGAYAVVLWWSHLAGCWRNVDRWIVISEFVRDVFVRAGVGEEKIRVLPHCHIGEVEALPFPREGKPRFLYLGRLTDAKGVRVLIESWRELKKDGFEGVLEIAGGGDLEEEVREAAESLDDCNFHGYVQGDEKRELLTSCVALLVPSIWWEAFGLVTLDAYAIGRPVIASKSGGLRETVVEGETGWLHESGDAESLASAMREVAGDIEEAKRRGLRGMEWLAKNGEEAQWRERLLGMLNEVLENSGK
ncbi:MAG: glycosyltransferase family 4 protein [Roseibacillus sp.]|nr:glycosyltransferase family 4 protein [Roseibacillus sp.]